MTAPTHDAPPEQIKQNIETIAAVQGRAEFAPNKHQRFLETAAGFVGRPRFLYSAFTFATFWIALNLALPGIGMTAFDPPPFSGLQGLITLSALIITATIVATQNRQARIAEQRAHLDLQVNLLAEQKIAKVIALIEELRRDMPTVKNRVDAEADVMTHAVDPHVVVSALQQTLEAGDDVDPRSE